MGMNVAITGMGVVSALGHSPKELLDRLKRDEIAIEQTPWTRNDPDRCEWWAPIKDFDASQWLDDGLIAGTDPFAQYAIAAAKMAMKDSGLDKFDPLRTGIIMGTAKSATQSFERAQFDVDRLGRDGVTSKLMLKAWPNMAASQISMMWELHGPSLTISTGCAAGIDAIGLGARFVASGMVDVAIVGGTEGGVALGVGADGFVPASAYARDAFGMCPHTRDPRQACQPFDRDRSGMVFGEGTGIFIIESAAHARARGARVHGWIQGWGTCADGHHPSTPHPSGDWERRVMELALAEAGVGPEKISAIAGHGTGTPKGDIAEIRAINKLYGGLSRRIPTMSIKGTLGHPTGSAGALNLIVGLQGMAEKTMLHTGSTVTPDPEIQFDLVLGEPRDMAIDWLMVDAFGFGGQNASMIISANPT